MPEEISQDSCKIKEREILGRSNRIRNKKKEQ